MRFRLEHPSELRTWALYGFDHSGLGFWCEVRRRGHLLASYDGLSAPGGMTSIQGVLDLLVNHGLVTESDVAAALLELPHRDAADIQDPDLRRAAEVIERLREAASEG